MEDEFVLLIPLGPGSHELTRLADFLDSLQRFQPTGCAGVVVVDDGGHGNRILDFTQGFTPVHILRNPRQGKGSGWAGGLTAGLLHGYEQILDHYRASYVLRVDTDALVVGPFHDKIKTVFASNPRIGMVGSYLRPDSERHHIPRALAAKIQKLQRFLAIWRLPKYHLRWGLSSDARKVNRYIRQAKRNGYVEGELCEGGAYAVSFAVLREYERRGILRELLIFVGAPVSEDGIAAILIKACDFEIYNLSNPGEVFCIDSRGLLHPPEELVRNGCSIIHSLKDFGSHRESDLRAFFRHARLPNTLQTR